MTNIDSGFNLENSYITLPKSFYTNIEPKPVSAPKLAMLNESLAKELGLNIDYLKTKEGLDILAGNTIPEGLIAIAQAYAGHQFGYFTMLGDGRAALIGEQITPTGERFDIQLKGSGKTPYSREGDGRAGLGPMLREYIISEAMHHLGIPTTRSLAVVKTGDKIYREREFEGAILTRVAKSHIRVGTFEYAAKYGNVEDLKMLADYTIKRHYPNATTKENPYIELLSSVVKTQAELIVKWQLIGFIHGVMNTDNMSIAGETIDYGPCAYMDEYNLETKFSSIDHRGRYAYGNQPGIGLWNLSRFAEALLPLIDRDTDNAIKVAENILIEFGNKYEKQYYVGMLRKLGIFECKNSDKMIIDSLLDAMKKHSVDYTNFFLQLTYSELPKLAFFKTEEFKNWKEEYKLRLKTQEQTIEESQKLMKKTNPVLIPRNYLVEEALDSAVEKNDLSKLIGLLEALRNPYDFEKKDRKFIKTPDASSVPYKTYCGT